MPEAEIPARMQEIIEDFRWAESREKIEMLIQYSDQLPPLPGWLQAEKNAMQPVPECMTPVFIYAQNNGDGLTFFLDVPPSSPTVRGFAAILAEGLHGTTPEQILRVPADFFREMGLDTVLTQQRLNGFSAILAHMKALALREMEKG